MVSLLDQRVDTAVNEYIATAYLLKALDFDQTRCEAFKMSRIWRLLLRFLSESVEKEHRQVKRLLSSKGCHIAKEEVMPNRNVHVVYIHKGYEYHCEIMPNVLKVKCEEKLRELLHLAGEQA